MLCGNCEKDFEALWLGTTYCSKYCRQKACNRRRYQVRKNDPTYKKAKSTHGPGYNRSFASTRRWLLDIIKSAPCHDCAHKFPPYCMDFDHREPSTKEQDISKMQKGNMRSLMRELMKCDLVCAICHRKREHERKEISNALADLGL